VPVNFHSLEKAIFRQQTRDAKGCASQKTALTLPTSHGRIVRWITILAPGSALPVVVQAQPALVCDPSNWNGINRMHQPAGRQQAWHAGFFVSGPNRLGPTGDSSE
jgi:hypothetical protein